MYLDEFKARLAKDWWLCLKSLHPFSRFTRDCDLRL